MSTDLVVIIFIFGTVCFCIFLSCLFVNLLARPLKMKGILFLDTAREDEKQLRMEVPELQFHWDEYQRLQELIVKQEWYLGNIIRPDHPIRAIFYHYIVPCLWKKKLAKCKKHKNDYELLLKMHLIPEEESFVIHR